MLKCSTRINQHNEQQKKIKQHNKNHAKEKEVDVDTKSNNRKIKETSRDTNLEYEEEVVLTRRNIATEILQIERE